MVANNASASSSTFSVPPRIEPQYVRIVGDSVGVVNLTPAALQSLADKAPIGTVVRHTPSMRQLSMPTGEQLYVREDADVDIQALAQPPQAKIPLKRHFRVHWINVDNQEEPPPEKKAKKLSQAGRFSSVDIPAALRKRVPTPSELAAPSVAFRLSSQGIPKKEQILVKPSYLEPLSVIRCNIVHRCLSMLIYVVRMMRAVATNKSVKLAEVLTRLHPRIAALLERTKAVATTSGDHLERIEAHKLHSALLKHEVAMRRLIIQASRREHYKGHS
ncbi:unnamed protein product [Nippostrongylus brasiliensis]|uniref:Transcription initiation factor TFIID subunit 6 (inferred by orthology to a human protein) n=1 Tax=Nippostrongylus brasiliensis TaxID=27835 RepID=A0A158QZJ6_NIPBR|nr:unnamed protein product [Nippostrongylus brasiliensis]